MIKRIGKGNTQANGFQTVFRVKGAKAREKTVVIPSQTPRSNFSARRSHKKSRTGCQNCKQRRVKCDETRVEGCLNCRNHGIDCDYVIVDVGDVVSANSSVSSPSTRTIAATTNSSLVATPSSTDTTILYLPLSLSTPFKYQLPTEITSYRRTLQHFQDFTCQTITTPDGIRIYESSVLAIADQSDYLMHAILGISAGHLAWHARLQDSPIELRMHRQAEAYHWQRALRGFRSSLDNTDQGQPEIVDALMSACMLIGIHSYTLPPSEEGTSFVWRTEHERPEALRWLSFQSGFRVVLRSLRSRVALSKWLAIFNSAAPGEGGFHKDIDITQGIYKDFLDICRIDEHSSPNNNPYVDTIRDLFALLRIDQPTMANFAPLMAFMGRLAGPFQQLLIQRDSAALLVVAYWLALMIRLQLWWIQERAYQECIAIVIFLKNNKTPRVRRMLEFPAKAVGIDLFDG